MITNTHKFLLILVKSLQLLATRSLFFRVFENLTYLRVEVFIFPSYQQKLVCVSNHLMSSI